MNALESFTLWLPGELSYAAVKGGKHVGFENSGYADRVTRARRGTSERSMYTFLGTEWFAAQRAMATGFHYSPEHAKSAQLQFAKFASGLFDKYATVAWLQSGAPATQKSYEFTALVKGIDVIAIAPWREHDEGFDPRTELLKPFEDTAFSDGILELQTNLVRAADAPHAHPDRTELLSKVSSQALRLGGKATQCYLAYAESYLTPAQYTLPISELA